ncbi:Site-specific recombinase XerD [Mycolicibacterium fluoranthenivorans]|uniref:Site-specific recombinase XerD n=1 Tax=Mycolicibacterium fluoranthenivorans TaxID=258505 RepID=A0A1G4VFV2_9MYCO|nr:Site-specific recombinase XerD [Mycolicibacterium fluoranthenivorans]
MTTKLSVSSLRVASLASVNLKTRLEVRSPELPQIVKKWRTWQFAQSLSARTVDERIATVMRMAAWCRVEPDRASADDIASWLAEGGEWCANTRWTYHTQLAAWFLWLQKQDERVDNPMINITKSKRPRTEPRPVSNQGMQRLLSVRAHRRTKAMVLLMAFQGFRAHEVAKVKGEHLDLVERTITVVGKGGVEATLPLHHRVVEIAYQMPRRGFWFAGVDRGHQRRESICSTVKEAMIRAGVAGSGHCLRHWFATALLEADVDVRTVQVLLRHQNLSSTEIYTLVSARRRAEGIECLDPFRVAPPKPLSPEAQAIVNAEWRDADAA